MKDSSLRLRIPWVGLVAVLFGVAPRANATDVGGTLSTNATWSLAGSPYVLTNTLVVSDGVSLTVEAGVSIEGKPGAPLRVAGSIFAMGTSTNPVIFTRAAGTNKAPAIQLVGLSPSNMSATGIFTFCQFTYLTNGNSSISGLYANVVISGCQFSNTVTTNASNAYAVVRMQESMLTLTQSGSTLAGSFVWAINSYGSIISNTAASVADLVRCSGKHSAFSGVPWNVTYNRFGPCGDDAIDLTSFGTNIPPCLVEGNIVSNSVDKGLNLSTLQVSVRNNVVIKCGRALACGSANLDAANNTFIASSNSIDFFPSSNLSVIINSIIRDSVVTNVSWATQVNLMVSYCNVSGTNVVPGVGNMNVDPGFINMAGGDYRLSSNSPCIDVGINKSWMVSALDAGGSPRIQGASVDMGAYESDVVTTNIPPWGGTPTFSMVGVQPERDHVAVHSIISLAAWKDRIFVGTGDYNYHPGPIIVSSFVPAEGRFVAEFSLGTDSIERFRLIGDELYALSTDPVHFAYFCDYAVRSVEGWRSRTPGGFLHVYDVSRALDGTLYLVGSKEVNETATSGAVVYTSRDSGVTWTDVTPAASTAFRFYWSFCLGNDLYVDGFRRSNGVWSGSGIASTYLDSLAVVGPMQSQVAAYLSSGALMIYNGTNTVSVLSPVTEIASVSNTLYCLYGTGHLVRTTNLWAPSPSWEWFDLVALPGGVQSMAVLSNTVYVGCTNGTLWAAGFGGPDVPVATNPVASMLSDWFGYSSASWGNRLVVGAPRTSTTYLEEGAVWQFSRNLDGTLSNEGVIRPPVSHWSGFFGSDVAMASNTLCVVEDSASENGAEVADMAMVHVYQSTNSQWSLCATLTNHHCLTVATDDDWMALGTRDNVLMYRLTNGLPVYHQELATTWSSAYKPLTVTRMSGGRLFVGVCGDYSRNGGPGVVRVFERSGGTNWSQSTALYRPDASYSSGYKPDAFGFALAAQSSWLVVGAPRDDKQFTNAGAVCIYSLTASNPAQYALHSTIYSPCPQTEGLFGQGLSLEGDRLFVYGAGEASDDGHGVWYEYRLVSTNWSYCNRFISTLGEFGEYGSACTVVGSNVIFAAAFTNGSAQSNNSPLVAVTPASTRTYTNWISLSGLVGVDAEPASDPDEDGADNLSEFVSGLNPGIPDSHGVGMMESNGTPALVQEGTTRTLHVVRPKYAPLQGLSFNLSYGGSVMTSTGQSMKFPLRIESLNDNWEKFVYSLPATNRIFVRSSATLQNP